MTGKEAKQVRIDLNVSAHDVAAKIGVSPQTVYNWESKNVPIRREYESVLAAFQRQVGVMQSVGKGGAALVSTDALNRNFETLTKTIELVSALGQSERAYLLQYLDRVYWEEKRALTNVPRISGNIAA